MGRDLVFLGLDGEAIDGRYRLLQSSQGDRLLATGDRITTDQALEWLTTIGGRFDRRKQRVIACWYGSSYDVNNILRDLPAATLRDLWARGETRHGRYFLRWFNHKLFGVYGPAGGLTTFDLFGYFQRPFVDVLHDLGLADPADLAFLRRMKDGRAGFAAGDMATIERYNGLEVDRLAALAALVYDLHLRAGIGIGSLHGAGASAAAMLRDQGVDHWLPRVPALFDEPTRAAYFGGRIQLHWQGHFDRVWTYDINSAYASIAADLPRLLPDRWQRFRPAAGDPVDPYSIYQVSFSFDVRGHVCYPLPVRSSWGSIVYPPRGEGWYWGVELAAAGLTPGEIRIDQVVRPAWDRADRPFAFLADFYDTRREYKRAGDLREKAIKYAMSAIYGKLAQSRRGVRRPAFTNLAYAGLITAGCRAAIARAIHGQERAVIAITTDGIVSSRPLAIGGATAENAEFGGWTVKDGFNAWFVQPGVYWRSDSAGRELVKSRGMLPRDLLDNKAAIMAGIAAGVNSIRYRSRYFRSLGLCLLPSGDIAGDWCEWIETERKIDLVLEHWRPCYWPDMRPGPGEDHLTGARPMFCPIIPPGASLPYKDRRGWRLAGIKRAKTDEILAQREITG